MEKGKVKKVKRKFGSVFKGKKQCTRQDARNGENEKADPQHKEMVDSDKDYLPDEIHAEEQNTGSLEENSQATLGESFASDEKLLKDLPSEGYQKLVEHLQPLSATGRDYRSLADRMGYSNQYIQWLESTHDPVMNLLREYRNNDRKISELTLLLKELERYDVVEDLQPYIDATCSQAQTLQKQQILEKNEDLRLIQDWYHAFVCSAKKDRAFVKKLVQKMENPPYKLRLCFSERDFLGGGCHLETAAVAIEKRCKKFVAVLSSNFDESEGASFESHIAMSLSASEREERYIPILIEDAYRHKIPKTIKHLYHLDYTRIDKSIFWDRLANTLTA